MAPAYTYEQPCGAYARVSRSPCRARDLAGRLARTGLISARGAGGMRPTPGCHQHSVGTDSRSRSSSVRARSPRPAPVRSAAMPAVRRRRERHQRSGHRSYEGASASISFVLPAGIVPARSNLPGVLRSGRWTARSWPRRRGHRLGGSFAGGRPAARRPACRRDHQRSARGAGWQRLAAWMPRADGLDRLGDGVLDPSAHSRLRPVTPLR